MFIKPLPIQILLRSPDPPILRQLLTSRESEAAYLEKLNEGIAKGTSWERVTDMIQLENSRKSKPGRQPTSLSLLFRHLVTLSSTSLHLTLHLALVRSSYKLPLPASLAVR
jgi:hypothetical protein